MYRIALLSLLYLTKVDSASYYDQSSTYGLSTPYPYSSQSNYNNQYSMKTGLYGNDVTGQGGRYPNYSPGSGYGTSSSYSYNGVSGGLYNQPSGSTTRYAQSYGTTSYGANSYGSKAYGSTNYGSSYGSSYGAGYSTPGYGNSYTSSGYGSSPYGSTYGAGYGSTNLGKYNTPAYGSSSYGMGSGSGLYGKNYGSSTYGSGSYGSGSYGSGSYGSGSYGSGGYGSGGFGSGGYGSPSLGSSYGSSYGKGIGRGYTSFESPYLGTSRYQCVDRSPQNDIWIDSVMGIWYGVEVLQHMGADMSRNDYDDYWHRSCIVIHIAEPLEQPSTENQLYHVQHLKAKFRQDFRHLRLLWDEDGHSVEYALYFRNDSAGYWQVYDGQNGTLVNRPNYQQFGGSVQVLKAVNDHLVLSFCQEPNNGKPAQLYTVLFSRDPGTMQRWEIEAVHTLLQAKQLSVASRRMVCGNGADKPVYSIIFSIFLCILSFTIRS